MDPSEYLSQTEKSVIQLFDSLVFYHDLIRESLPPVFITDYLAGDCNKDKFEAWEKENEAKIKYSLEKQREYFGYTVSQGAICGSILQIAFMGIQKFSDNKSIPESCSDLLSEKSKAVKFCIGRSVRNIPIGLIIYAARNQYNHMDENEYNAVTTKIFDNIALNISDGSFKDPAFDLSNPNLVNYAHNAMGLMGWNNFESYQKDIFSLIGQKEI